MTWLFILAVVVAVGGFLVARRKPAKQLTAGGDWRPALEAAAQTLGGRPALSGGEAELRAEHQGLTVTVKLRGDVAVAECPLHPGAAAARIYLASGAAEPPTDIAHFPVVTLPPAYALDPPVVLRSDDSATALAFADRAPTELLALLRSPPRAVEILVRGGSLRLTVRGLQSRAEAVEEVVKTTANLASYLGGDRGASEASTRQLPARAAAPEVCALCSGERRPGVDWVRCRRCGSLHHAECWNTAQHCAKPDCGAAISDPA